jgi:transcriptional regulator with GAF, ATPase, and Fis domain
VLLLDNQLGDKKLSTISPVSLKVLGGLVSSFFKLRTLREALSTLDATVSKTVNRQQILNQISIQSSAGRSQSEILNSIPDQFVDFHLCDQACILTPAAGGEYEIRYARALSDELRGQILQPGDRLAGMAAATNKAVMSSPSQEKLVEELFDSANQSGLAAPISFGAEIFAILEMENSKADQFNEYDLELIQIFCLSIGSLLANLKLVDQVKAQVDRQEKLYEITNKLRRSLDMSTILQISASEIGRIANARKASIQITIAEQPEPDLDPETSGGEE